MANPDTRILRWSLRLSGDNLAQMVLPEDPRVIRIAISRARTDTEHDIQLNELDLSISAGRRYALRFCARADAPRRVSFGIAQAHEPWANLGLFERVDLTPEWQAFQAEVTPSSGDDNVRVHFDLGGNNQSVDLRDVELIDLRDGRSVLPVSLVKDSETSDRDVAQSEPAIPVGQLEFGSLRRLTPVSRYWGWDRGLPIDRYYIEQFLARNATDVRGRVLEIGDDEYTRRFGGQRVDRGDVLHVAAGNPKATIVADLTDADHIPSGRFDCIILTQTLHFIYDVRAALSTIHRILAPGGVLLATFPGISHQGRGEWSDSWYWAFTRRSALRLFDELFGEGEVTVEAHGNVLSATAFLQGLAAEELDREELDRTDPDYELILAVRAAKGGTYDGYRPSRRSESGALTPGALILMYHRVSDVRPDPWDLAVTPQHFAQQLEVLRDRTHILSLHDLLDSLDRGAVPDRSVVITFDDGYADNLYAAKPLLEHYEVPATFFLTSGSVGSDREFWWDELERVVFEPRTLPETLRLELGEEQRVWGLGGSANLTDEEFMRYQGWKAVEGAPTARHRLFLDLHPILKSASEHERRRMLDALVRWSSVGPRPRLAPRPLSSEEAMRLAQGGLFDIGAHTVTHPVLAVLDLAAQRNELQKSKSDLEALLDRHISSFAYPYGSADVYTADTVRAVRDSGFRSACTTAPGLVGKGVDPLQLPRQMVLDWDRARFADRLSHWLGAQSRFADSG